MIEHRPERTVRLIPTGSLHKRHAAAHHDLPTGAVEAMMMRPTEQHAVVGVRGAAPRMLRHVVDLAPGCRNDASAIAGADRSALVGVEKTFGGAEVHDAPVRIEDDLLNRSGAGDAVRERRGNRGMRALDACGAVIEVVDRRRDDQRRRGSAERRRIG